MKKALIFYLYGNRNAGDMAICTGAIELLKSKGYSISMVSRFSESEEEYYRSKQYINEYYPDVKVHPGPFSFERNFSWLEKLKAYAKSFLKSIGLIRDQEIIKLINEADVVFFNGGNLLRGSCIADYLRLIALFYPIKMAYKVGKTIYCLPQSTAKISKIGKVLLGRYLKLFKKVYVREEISFNKLTELFPKIEFILSTDMAFFCKDNNYVLTKMDEVNIDLKEENNVALIFRNSGIGDIGDLDNKIAEKLNSLVKTYVKSHEDNNYVIIIQTEKDRNVSERIYNDLKNYVNIQIIELHDPMLLREVYKKMKFTISMRLHAAILSLSALTPVYGIFSELWGLKNPGIMESYSMPYIVIENSKIKNIESIDDHNCKDKVRAYIEAYRKKIEFI